MKGSTALLVVSLFAVSPESASGSLCKWVDENGTTHYAEQCPERVDSSSIALDPAPSPAMQAEAARRAEALSERRHAAAARGEGDAAAQATEPDTTRTGCERAWRESEILRLGVPVYRAEDGRLYYRGSLHDHWFEGDRNYLDDAQREREQKSLDLKLANQCAAHGPQKSTYIFRFRQPPPLTELLELMAETQATGRPAMEEVCAYARNMQRELGELKSGIPSDDERALQKALDIGCR